MNKKMLLIKKIQLKFNLIKNNYMIKLFII